MKKTVGILIFPNIEVLDFCGPFEVFSVTRLNEETRAHDASPFNVFLVAEKKETITTVGGMKVVPEHNLETCPKLDVLVVPGGIGARQQMTNLCLLQWIQARSAEAELTTSVCTGSLILASAGLLAEKRATTHWSVLDDMQQRFPAVKVLRDQHVVEEGNILTSASISAGIDMALLVVKRYFGEAVARATARRMEYPYPDSNARRVEIR